MHYLCLLFNKILKTLPYFFSGSGEKYKLLRNFEKILKIFDKNSIEKLYF